MKVNNAQYKIDDNSVLNYYEIKNDKPKLLLLHAQGTDSLSLWMLLVSYLNIFKVYKWKNKKIYWGKVCFIMQKMKK